MTLKLVKAERKKVKLKLGIGSPSGGGKTYSSLLLAYGLCGDWGKIAVIDTENESASLYTHLGAYNTIVLPPPFTPERYIEAIHACVEAGMEVIIIDSMTPEWSGQGGLLEYHAALPGNSFANWAKVTPRHKKFLDTILQADCHIIGTTRKKTDWVIEDNDRGKKEPRKVGLADDQRGGLEYEWTISFNLSQNHLVSVDKDRTGLFMGKPEFVITADTGKSLRDWCETGVEAPKTQQKVYDGSSDQQKKMFETLKGQGIDEKYYGDIHEKMMGRPAKDFSKVIVEVTAQ